jgi:hypothetical protein
MREIDAAVAQVVGHPDGGQRDTAQARVAQIARQRVRQFSQDNLGDALRSSTFTQCTSPLHQRHAADAASLLSSYSIGITIMTFCFRTLIMQTKLVPQGFERFSPARATVCGRSREFRHFG